MFRNTLQKSLVVSKLYYTFAKAFRYESLRTKIMKIIKTKKNGKGNS